MDYQTEYDEYWLRKDRWGSNSFRDPHVLANEIERVCGCGSLLDVGCGMGLLVHTLVKRGIDANGTDIALRVVEEGNRQMPGRFHVGSILALPFPDGAFESVSSTDCLEHIAEVDVPQALRELHRVCRRFGFIRLATTPDRDGRWHLTIRDRAWWETRFFEAGFRKHPLYQEVTPFDTLETEGWQITMLLEKIPAGVLVQYPLDALRTQRDSRMDMLRTSGRLSDAHIARYVLAKNYIRPNDVVLDAACGLGFGARILVDGSVAVRVLGMDESEFAVQYAQSMFGGDTHAPQFQRGDVCDLSDLQDQSVDVVVSFETVEHLGEPETFLREARRVLTPGGRFICSVPNLWVDDTGKAPHPRSHQVFDFGKIRELCARHFLVEQAYSLIAGGGMKLTGHARKLSEVPLATDPAAVEAEWWIIVAMKDPLAGSKSDYRESIFPCIGGAQLPNIAAFARDYENPWLVRSLATRGMRSRSPTLLRSLAERVLGSAPPHSADSGAALCVLAYQALEAENTDSVQQATMRARLEAYVRGPGANPHGHRWIVSNQYVLAKLLQKHGDLEKSQAAFWTCAQMDCLLFSPLLGTKTIDAAFSAGWLALGQGNRDAALKCWQHGLQEAHRLMQGSWAEIVGDFNAPLLFGMREATQVLDLATKCANGIHFLSRHAPLPVALIPQILYSLQETTNSLQNLVSELRIYNQALIEGNQWLTQNRESLERRVGELEKWNQKLTEGNQWLTENRESLEGRVGELEKWNQTLTEGNQWLTKNRESLEGRVGGLEKWNQTLTEGNQWLTKNRESLESRVNELEKWNRTLQPQVGSEDVALPDGSRAYFLIPHLDKAFRSKGQSDQVAILDPTIDGTFARAIFMQPPVELTFKLPTRARGKLSTAVAIHPDAWDKPNAGGCEFHLRVDGRLVFVVALDPAHLPEDRHWHELSLDIPESGDGCHQVTFETRGIGGSSEFRWALWREPKFALGGTAKETCQALE